MRTRPPTAPRPGYPASPCIDICTLDDDDVCLGCGRTIREIIDWSQMSADQQRSVIRSLPARTADGRSGR